MIVEFCSSLGKADMKLLGYLTKFPKMEFFGPNDTITFHSLSRNLRKRYICSSVLKIGFVHIFVCEIQNFFHTVILFFQTENVTMMHSTVDTQ